MKKITLIIILLLMSSTAIAEKYIVTLKQIKNDLIVSINNTVIGKAPNYAIAPPEKRTKTLNQLTSSIRYCKSKGEWAFTVSTDAAKKNTRDINYHLNTVNIYTKNKNISQHIIVEGERVVREAFRSGHQNPETFGFLIIIDCLNFGF